MTEPVVLLMLLVLALVLVLALEWALVLVPELELVPVLVVVVAVARAATVPVVAAAMGWPSGTAALTMMPGVALVAPSVPRPLAVVLNAAVDKHRPGRRSWALVAAQAVPGRHHSRHHASGWWPCAVVGG